MLTKNENKWTVITTLTFDDHEPNHEWFSGFVERCNLGHSPQFGATQTSMNFWQIQSLVGYIRTFRLGIQSIKKGL